jgi:S1-C subfamily serine protease
MSVLPEMRPTQSAALPRREVSVWNQIRPAIVTLSLRGRMSGVAALIDDSGYFVAHSSSVAGSQAWGTSYTGKQLTFNVVSQDKATMLVLLKTNEWVSGSAQPFHMPTGDQPEGGDLIAALPTGPLRMAYGTRHKLGVLNPSRRLVPLTEMRFETTPLSVGGALIFSGSGDLIGSLNATLVGSDNPLRNQNSVGGGFGNQRPTNQSNNNNIADSAAGGSNNSRLQYQNVGPNPMTVAYTVSADFVRHVLEGFLSSSHEVEFAVLGVMCTDSVGGGALIQSVTAGSPAERSGLRAGDVLLNIAGNQIDDQIAFARVMLQQKVGKKIAMVVQRGPSKLLVDIVPAKSAD